MFCDTRPTGRKRPPFLPAVYTGIRFIFAWKTSLFTIGSSTRRDSIGLSPKRS